MDGLETALFLAVAYGMLVTGYLIRGFVDYVKRKSAKL